LLLPRFPRLLNPGVLSSTIAEGVRAGKFGYVGKAYGVYQGTPIIEDPSFEPATVEISDQVVLLPREKALELKGAPTSAPGGPERIPLVAEGHGAGPEGPIQPVSVETQVSSKQRLSWEGELPPQKWTNFYMKVLTRFATDPSLRLRVQFEVSPEIQVLQAQLNEIEIALKELGLDTQALKAESKE
jgi:hypothetical protein